MQDRELPYNLDAELDVLSACLTSRDALALVVGAGLDAADFYRDDHGSLFKAMVKTLHGEAPSPLTGVREAGTPSDWNLALDLSDRFVVPAHAEYHARVVIGHATRRAAIVAHKDALMDLFDPTIEDPVTAGLGRVLSVASRRGRSSTRDWFDIVDERFGEINDLARMPREQRPVPFTLGLPDLDAMANIEPGDMIVLGARPSSGKTALLLQILTHVARRLPVLFFSLEMTGRALAARYFTYELGVSAQRQRAGNLDPGEIEQLGSVPAKAQYQRLRIEDAEEGALTVAAMRAIAIREHARCGGLGLIAVDHMLEVQAEDPRATGHARITQVYRDTRRIARALQIPLLALHQLNRAAASEDTEPTMANLRESGSIEEVADHIWLLHRPERDEAVNNATLIYAKQRNGPVGRIEMVYEGRRTRFACRAAERPGVL